MYNGCVIVQCVDIYNYTGCVIVQCVLMCTLVVILCTVCWYVHWLCYCAVCVDIYIGCVIV